MVYSPQAQAVTPAGMRRKKNRMAPIIEEQAKQGIATQMVMQQKDQEQADEEWAFQKQSTEKGLSQTQQQIDMQEEQMEFNKKMDYAKLGMGAISTTIEVLDFLDIF
jgi:hypothetical protein